MKTFKYYLEAVEKTVVIYPGRFHPFHLGHAKVYNYLTKAYGDVYIATSNKVDPPKSPFTFEEKKKMMMFTGVPEDAIVQTKQPYQAHEILENYDPELTSVIFAVSEKDMAEDPRFTFKPKKDGSPSYFQPLEGQEQLQPFSKHGYITTVPTFKFEVLGDEIKSATELRSKFAQSNAETQKEMIVDLYGKYNKDIHNILASGILAEAVYKGNLGFEELVKFYDIADAEDILELEMIIKDENFKKFKDLMSRVLGVTLV